MISWPKAGNIIFPSPTFLYAERMAATGPIMPSAGAKSPYTTKKENVC